MCTTASYAPHEIQDKVKESIGGPPAPGVPRVLFLFMYVFLPPSPFSGAYIPILGVSFTVDCDLKIAACSGKMITWE